MPAAVNLLARAVSLLPATDPVRFDCLSALAFALIETGDFARLETVGAEMNAVAADSGDPGVKAHAALVGLWIRLFMSPEGWAEDALSEVTRGIAVFEQLGDEQGLSKSWSLLGLVHLYTTQFRPSEEAWERSSVHAHRAGNRREELESLSWVPICVWAWADTRGRSARTMPKRDRARAGRQEGPVHRTLRPGRARGGARQIRRSAGADRAVEGFAGGACTYRLDPQGR